MKAELEGLILARDAMQHAADAQGAHHLRAIYKARLEDVCARFPNISPDQLERAIQRAHLRWLAAQKKTSTLPPRA